MENIMLKNALAIIFTLLFAAACQSKSADSYGASAAGAGGIGITNENGFASAAESDLVSNIGDRVYFAFDSSAIDAEAQNTLARQAAWLKANPQVGITVEGHCDERGTREYNLALGERRANSVKEHLVSLGIEPSRINTISYGKERPIVLGTGEAVWRLNRTGIVVISN
jgi:peptidoglycan-associated lipoprotein